VQTPKLADASALIRAGSLPEKVVPVCLDAALVSRYEELEGELVKEAEQASDSLAGGRAAQLRQQLVELRGQMQSSTVPFRFRALPSPRYKSLKRAHPPRKSEDGSPVDRDGILRVNEDTFFIPLMRACLTEPVLDDETFRILVEERLSDGQLERLTTEVWRLNSSRVDLPF
jgi:hypothetical protein